VSTIKELVKDVGELFEKSSVILPPDLTLELSHHHGIENFHRFGCAMVTVIDRAYRKKLIGLLPGQFHPEHFHKIKEETYQVLYGDLLLSLGKNSRCLVTGEILTVKRRVKHKFTTAYGCVFEEISLGWVTNDSFYTDPTITANKDRKTFVRDWRLPR
jgi:N-acetylneuraminate synthase